MGDRSIGNLLILGSEILETEENERISLIMDNSNSTKVQSKHRTLKQSFPKQAVKKA
jgi:hypothetical protein